MQKGSPLAFGSGWKHPSLLPPLVQALLCVAVLEVLGKARVVRAGHHHVVVHARARGGRAAPHARAAVGGTRGAGARVGQGGARDRAAGGAERARRARGARRQRGGAQREHVADAFRREPDNSPREPAGGAKTRRGSRGRRTGWRARKRVCAARVCERRCSLANRGDCTPESAAGRARLTRRRPLKLRSLADTPGAMDHACPSGNPSETDTRRAPKKLAGSHVLSPCFEVSGVTTDLENRRSRRSSGATPRGVAERGGGAASVVRPPVGW
jgi:hypothetical protein